MKKKIRYLIYAIINIISYSVIKYFKIINRNKTKVFVYTDSRGFEISKIKNRKSPFSSYLLGLIKKYSCDVYISPEKHTTIFDFLHKLKLKGGSSKYDYVIAHIGVVDFSPRPYTDIEAIISLKKHKIIDTFGEQFYNILTKLDIYNESYLGEKTSSIISFNTLKRVGKEFNTISNLIWITCNPVDIKWKGNYKRERPSNINLVNDKSIILKGYLNNIYSIIDFTELSLFEVQKYTCDNIHMSKKGMELIELKIEECLQKK